MAAELLAQAVFLEGKHPQAFPFFGVERRGAPVTAYVRIDDRPIGVRTGITNPDIVVVLEEGLLRTAGVTAGLKPDGLLLVNTPSRPEAIAHLFPGRIVTVDATAIALAHGLGNRAAPIVNTAVLGALARSSGIATLGSLVEVVRRFIPAKASENVETLMEAYHGVVEETRLVA